MNEKQFTPEVNFNNEEEIKKDTPITLGDMSNLIRSEERKSKELDISKILKSAGLNFDQIHPLIFDYFTNAEFVASLPDDLKYNAEKIGLLLKNSSLFADFIARSRSKIYGEIIQIPESLHGNGRIRRAEEGELILINKLKEEGIDPNYVLYFRRTQPEVDNPKPELYWTSDYWETLTGLRSEISGEQREKSIILCSNLGDISSDSRLISDINDDNGLPVRRESLLPYSQNRALFVIKK